MTAAEIAEALGAAYLSGAWWRCRCPVHQSRGASLAIRDGESRLLVKCWAGCDSRDVLAELKRLDLLGGDDRPVSMEGLDRQRERDLADRQCRSTNALDLFFNQSRPAAGTLVERYLNGRGIWIRIPDTVRASSGWLRHRESGGEQRPAMLGLVEHVEHGPIAVHCTYLAIDGSCKATIDPNKKFFGPVKGAAVRLGPVRANQWLVIGEGIESTASAMQLWGLSSGWAALSESGLRNLVLPPEARLIVIACDNDENGVGQAAARDAAWLWTEAGRTVRVMVPPQSNTDFNDILKRSLLNDHPARFRRSHSALAPA
jgi:putative DNA primase/helicase